jgi:hypothetical protein
MTIEESLALRRKYISPFFRREFNKINLSKADGRKHNEMVCMICCWLLDHDIDFITQARFKQNRYRPDIFVPVGLPKMIIEVRNTETQRQSLNKMPNIPEELREEIIYVDAHAEFNEKMVL